MSFSGFFVVLVGGFEDEVAGAAVFTDADVCVAEADVPVASDGGFAGETSVLVGEDEACLVEMSFSVIVTAVGL